MDARTALKQAKAAQTDIDAILSRAPILPQPPEFPKIEWDDIVGGIALFVMFVIMFAVPWGM